jgi:hypothetical protein
VVYWKTPENGTEAPLLMDTEPVNCSPTAAAFGATAPNPVIWIASDPPAVTGQPAAGVCMYVLPPKLMVRLLAVALEVPVLLRRM